MPYKSYEEMTTEVQDMCRFYEEKSKQLFEERMKREREKREKRKLRIKDVLIANPSFSIRDAIDHINYMDSFEYEIWVDVNKSQHQFEEERMERDSTKDIPDEPKRGD